MSSAPHRLDGASFDEDEWLPSAINANDLTGLNYLYVNKLILAYHFDVDDKLDEYADEAEKFLAGMLSVYSVPLFHLYNALGKLRLVGGGSSKKHPGDMNSVNKRLHWMAIWSEATPSTFQHKFDLIAAEKARVLRVTLTALYPITSKPSLVPGKMALPMRKLWPTNSMPAFGWRGATSALPVSSCAKPTACTVNGGR